MQFSEREKSFSIEEEHDIGKCNVRLDTLNQFIGKKIVEVRQIGCEWNGHGFEFSFDKEPSKTLILQSIYTGSEPQDFNDCMRIGVGTYTYRISCKKQE